MRRDWKKLNKRLKKCVGKKIGHYLRLFLSLRCINFDETFEGL